MVRGLTILLGALMVIQVLRPLNLPGLRRRADVWKIAAAALALISLVAVIKPN